MNAKQPSADLQINLLADGDDRNGFSCGVERCDRYLKTQAGQDVRRRANAVFVVTSFAESERVLVLPEAAPPGLT